MKVTLGFDTSELDLQVKDLLALLEGRDNFVCDFSELLSDIILGKWSTTVGAGGVTYATLRPRFGDSYNRLRAALLTDKPSNHGAFSKVNANSEPEDRRAP